MNRSKLMSVVLAVGLGLAGSISVGAGSLQGGRYGETPADGLRNALEALGVVFGEVGLEVGACFGGDRADLVESLAEADSSHQRHRTVDIRRLVREAGASGSETGEAGLEGAYRIAANAFRRRVFDRRRGAGRYEPTRTVLGVAGPDPIRPQSIGAKISRLKK